MNRLAAMMLPATLVACAGPGGTGSSSGEIRDDPVTRVLSLADEYTRGYYGHFPEDATEMGYPEAPLDRFSDRSPRGRAAWEAQEDAWLAALSQLDSASLVGTEAEIPYGYLRERLEASIGRRVCRTDLWNVSPTWTGWQNVMALVLGEQAVESAADHDRVVARLADVPRYLAAEMANLRDGVETRHTAPRTNVAAVIEQLDGILGAPIEQSPFYSPAARSDDAAFRARIRTLVSDRVHPAVRAYREFLADEYMARARDQIAVSSLPDGGSCYDASVRFWSSLTPSAREIHEAGVREMERIVAEMREIGRRSFGTEDVGALMRLVRTDPRYTFRTAEEIVQYNQAAVDRARAALPDWFGYIPKGEVILRPYPDYLKQSGGGFYSAGAEDGSRPGIYQFGTWEPGTISKAGQEATAFHETWPGHHLQVAVALEREGIHPITRYFYAAGFDEGWALYTERLADEMGLYSSHLARLGMLSAQAMRAGRLVVDPGMHVLGWSRSRAIDYMLEHTAESESSITSEIDRYLAVPGQATAYMMGSMRIAGLRAEAEQRLGDRFDIRAFHDRVIGNGSLTLALLEEVVDRWIGEQGRAP